MGGTKQINYENVANTHALMQILEAMDTEIDALRTLANELRTDTLGAGTSRQVWETEVDTDMDAMNDYLNYLNEPNGVHSGSNYTLATAAAATYTGAGQVYYRINGEDYWCDLDTTVAFTGTELLTDGKFRAYRMEINKLGVVTLTGPGDIDSDTAQNALLTLCSTARTADTATLAYVTVEANGANFIPGTTNTNATSNHVFYYTKGFERRMSGLTVAPSVALAIGTTDDEYSVGTLDAKIFGQNIAQIAADTTKTFDVADTITGSGKFGGHLIVINQAGNATVSLAADGIAESVSNMTYATAALAQAAVLACLKALPEVFVPVGYIITESKKAVFTFDTDDLAGTDGTGTFYSFSVGAWDRTADGAATLSQHGLNAPAIPATVTAAVPAATGSAAVTQNVKSGT